MLRAVLGERDAERERAEREQRRGEEQQRRIDRLELDLLLLNQKLEWFKKRYYGPRADTLKSEAELGQMLFQFGQELERKPVNPADLPAPANPPEDELRRVKKRKGRRNLANFENVPERIVVHELSPEQRACSGCGAERAEIGAEESWQLEYV